jgi:hypothetical protein
MKLINKANAGAQQEEKQMVDQKFELRYPSPQTAVDIFAGKMPLLKFEWVG